jgi:hypothetical protein
MDGNQSGMMAWGVQAWYDCAIDGTNGAYHRDINTRAELQQELPDLYRDPLGDPPGGQRIRRLLRQPVARADSPPSIPRRPSARLPGTQRE